MNAGGEQYELSFKVWQCHGRMVEAACSRVTHIYRSRKKPVNTHLDPHFDFIHRVSCVNLFSIICIAFVCKNVSFQF